MSYTNPNNYAYGLVQGPLLNIFTPPQPATFNPGDNNKSQIGATWINTTNNNYYALTSYNNGNPVWTLLGPIGGAAGLTYTVDATNAVNVTANSVTYLTNPGIITASLPAGAVTGQVVWLIDNNVGAGPAGIIVRANAGATIIDANNQVSTVAGTMTFANVAIVASLSIAIQLMCTVAGTEWTVVTSNYPGLAA